MCSWIVGVLEMGTGLYALDTYSYPYPHTHQPFIHKNNTYTYKTVETNDVIRCVCRNFVSTRRTSDTSSSKPSGTKDVGEELPIDEQTLGMFKPISCAKTNKNNKNVCSNVSFDFVNVYLLCSFVSVRRAWCSPKRRAWEYLTKKYSPPKKCFLWRKYKK